jgi:hypothetical protein
LSRVLDSGHAWISHGLYVEREPWGVGAWMSTWMCPPRTWPESWTWDTNVGLVRFSRGDPF